MPALAGSGDQAWDSAWALGFEDRDVTIVMDADRAGRLAAQRIQRDLTDVARTVTITDGLAADGFRLPITCACRLRTCAERCRPSACMLSGK